MFQDSILTVGRFKYLKGAAALSVACVALYAVDHPAIKPGGGTWLGYALGTVGAILILWLLSFGVRKRAYASSLGTLRGWLSAHVYLGIALAVVATLHTGFEFGWNIHTLSYVLTMAVIASGVWGVALYFRVPGAMSGLLGGRTLREHALALEEIDRDSGRIAARFGPAVQQAVADSARSPVFSAAWRRFSGREPRCTTRRAVRDLEKAEAENAELRELYTLQFRRLRQLEVIRGYLRLRAWSEAWLLVHVPLSYALLAALVAHIVSVFVFW